MIPDEIDPLLTTSLTVPPILSPDLQVAVLSSRRRLPAKQSPWDFFAISELYFLVHHLATDKQYRKRDARNRQKQR
jgi:hypothetical protein